MSENVRGAIQPSRVLTSSLSWDLESPYLFDHFEVATWCGCDVFVNCLTCLSAKVVDLRRTMCVQTPSLSAVDGGF